MCGIAGSFNPLAPVAELRRERPPSSQSSGPGHAAAARLAHRGPDARGSWNAPDGRALLVQTRLSIIDVDERSNQPLVRRRTVTIFNGEIYNYRELRRELARLGAQFATEGDTEVIAAGFERWGLEVFERLRGMYAIGIYEPDRSRLTLARDVFGIKPLFYGLWRGELRFASEVKAIATQHTPSLNEPALWDLATFGFHFDHHSIWEGIVPLPPGGVLEVSRGANGLHLAVHESKRLEALSSGSSKPAELLSVLDGSVGDHLLSDVPVATSLSGGLDSSIVTTLAKRRAPAITAYTHSFGVPDDPEVRHAELLCQAENIQQRIVETRVADPVELFDQICWHLEEPIPNIALATSYFLGSALGAEGYKVVLIGEGADELFGGYPWHALALAKSRDGSGRDLFRAYAARRAQQLLPPWIRPAAAERLRERLADQERRFALFFQEHPGTRLDKFLAFDQRYQLEFSQLARVDRMFMAHGVEARVPYLYDPVAVAARALADDGRVAPPRRSSWDRWFPSRHSAEGKLALRRAARELVPGAIADRPKFGRQGTANLHDSAAGQSITEFFRAVVTSSRYAAARAALSEILDWPRIARAEQPLSGKMQLFVGLLVGTTAHALNEFRAPDESRARAAFSNTFHERDHSRPTRRAA